MRTTFLRLVAMLTVFSSAGFNQLARADALDNWNPSQLETVTSPIGTYGYSLHSPVFGNGRYVAIGTFLGSDAGISQVSEDGIHWIRPASTPQNFITSLHDVAFGNGVFVAVGWGGLGNACLYSSTNGFDWPNRTNGLIANFFSVAYGAGTFVATGDGYLWGSSTGGQTNRNIYTSPDGINWTPRNSGSVNTIRDVAYGAGRFVAVDSEGYFYTSTLGSAWSRTLNGYPKGRIIFCKDFFFVPVGPGTNLVSTNGITWSLQTNNTANTFTDVVHGNGLYTAISASNLFTSLDGTNWKQRGLIAPTNVNFGTMAIGKNNLVVFGSNLPQLPAVPKAFVSDPFVDLTVSFWGSSQLNISGLQNRPYRIDYLDALQTGTNVWQTLSTFSLTNSPLRLTDLTATNSQRFYRGVLLP